MNGFLAKIVAWLNAGYPEGVPGPDRVPLLALLTRRLSNDEVKVVAQDLMDRGEFDHIDIGVLILQITDELPCPRHVERVRERLAAKGWPLDDARDAGGDRHSGPARHPVGVGRGRPCLMPVLDAALAGAATLCCRYRRMTAARRRC